MAVLAGRRPRPDGRTEPPFQQATPKSRCTYAIDRYVNETNRLYGVLDKQLAATRLHAPAPIPSPTWPAYPWIVPYERQGQNLDDFPNLKRWFAAIKAMPSTVRAYEQADALNKSPTVDEDAHKVLFGQTAKRA